MKRYRYWVTFFIEGKYRSEMVESDSEENAEKYIREKYSNAVLISAHLRIPGLY